LAAVVRVLGLEPAAGLRLESLEHDAGLGLQLEREGLEAGESGLELPGPGERLALALGRREDPCVPLGERDPHAPPRVAEHTSTKPRCIHRTPPRRIGGPANPMMRPEAAGFNHSGDPRARTRRAGDRARTGRPPSGRCLGEAFPGDGRGTFQTCRQADAHPGRSRVGVSRTWGRRMEIEAGIGKTARRAYGFDEVAIVPSRRTRDPDDVDISWEIDAFRF